ncbi:hypothetical protein H0H81_007731, partial [Sphagnurus paluster]
MSTPARSASLAVRTVGSFLESLNEAWDDFVAAGLRCTPGSGPKRTPLAFGCSTVAWTDKQRRKWTRCAQLHAEKPEACFEDEVPVGSRGPSMSRPSASPFVFGSRPPVLTPLLPRLVELPMPEVLPSRSQTLGTQVPKSPSPVPGPSRHPNRLPSPPPMDEDEEEPLPHENDGPAPTDEETDARPPAESDD